MKMPVPLSLFSIAAVIFSGGNAIADTSTGGSATVSEYTFDGSMPRATLDRYLSRAVTHLGLCCDRADEPQSNFEEDVRMLLDIGTKYIGRAAYVWYAWDDSAFLDDVVRKRAAYVHEKDPEILLQACVFETTHTNVNGIRIPLWVFSEFGLPVEARNFRYDAMLYRDGKFVDHWQKGASVPDMSQLETRMWFYYRARRYIDLGFEGIHFGQVHLMDNADPGHKYWFDLLTRVRAYAKEHARRHFVLCDAHTHGVVEEGKLLFDFHAYPLRTKDVISEPQKVILEEGFIDSIYGRSRGGLTPSGWTCRSLPYLVELDNYGVARPGVGGQEYFSWGWDEITWFAHQPEDYRNEWLKYAWEWVRQHDSNGWLQMPTQRCLADPVDGQSWYHANRPGPHVPLGFDQEDTIRRIWGGEAVASSR